MTREEAKTIILKHQFAFASMPDDIIEAINYLVKEEPRWIPVNERVAEFPCLACDIFDQIFIPSGIVVLNSRCYEGKDFDFNVEKFLRGKEVIMCDGKKAYLRPREIAAWMPLPEPYRVKGEKHDN